MTFGTGPQAIVDLLVRNWQVQRTGRPDVPPVTTEWRGELGTVFVTHDRDEIARNQNVHDLIHCYHPQAGAFDNVDKGHVEQGTSEFVQIDIETGDRTDRETHERLGARERMVGDRSDPDVAFHGGGGPYPGLFGEVKYTLEEYRRGLEEWDVARHDVIQMQLLNSNAAIKFEVELEHISINTADV